MDADGMRQAAGWGRSSSGLIGSGKKGRPPGTKAIAVRDWTEEPGFLADPKNQWRAFAAETTGGAVFVQQSLWVLEWKNPHPGKTLRSIDFAGDNNGVPILLGITPGQRK